MQSPVVDLERLREITCNDEELMREIVDALIDETSQQIGLLESAISSEDSQKCARLAHYSKGACANVGANGAAAMLSQIERLAATGDFSQCSNSLHALGREIDRLKTESGVA